MIKLPHTPHCQVVNVSQSTRTNSSYKLARSRTSRLLFVPEAETHDGHRLQSAENTKEKSTAKFRDIAQKTIRAMFPKQENTLGAVNLECK